MANLTPVNSFDNVIQLETNTIALGGVGGIMNAQAQALLNRTAYLKGVYDALTAMIGAVEGNGIAPLLNGIIPSQFLPSYVDDVLEYANLAAFPETGEQGKIYTALNTNFIYRWSGSNYLLIGDGNSVDVVGVGSNAFARYDQAQSLTDAQKSQFLTNICGKRSGNLITKTASYALQLSDFKNDVDLYDLVYLRMNSTTANNITIDTTLSSLPNLAEINIRNVGAGLSTLVATGTTLNGNLAFTAQHEVKTIVKVGLNEWDVVGVLS